jgi:hypothetical protein
MENKLKRLNSLYTELEKTKEAFLNSSVRVMEAGNKKLFTLDFLALSVNNRAISLINAYLDLIKNKNFLTAVTLTRLQLDNALRFFASTLVNDSNDFALHFIEGKPIKDYKDINNKNLSDGYLTKKLDQFFPGTQKLYTEACSYIHLSDRHFLATITKPNSKNGIVGVLVGSSENLNYNQKIEFTSTMLEVCKLVLIVVENWIDEKEKISKEIENRNSKSKIPY